MGTISLSGQFLRSAAAKHFVLLSYKGALPGKAEADAEFFHASCFVFAMEGIWFLATAGHVISQIEKAVDAGALVFDFVLHDQLAGKDFPIGVPIEFDPKAWLTLDMDDAGFDYAVYAIPELVARNLHAGGIEPIREEGWGAFPYSQYPHWLLIGIPSESKKSIGTGFLLNLTLIPLTESLHPPSTLAKLANRVFAKIRTQPGKDTVEIDDVEGMSGGPVFGVQLVEKEVRYWLIGIQSGFYTNERVVTFLPMTNFLGGLREVIKKIRSEIESGKASA